MGYFMKALSYPLIFPIVFILYYLDKLDKQRTITSHYECVFILD